MASSINPNNIDTAYPVAGQDNDSQGFRDNFTNIKTNFEYAESEIEDLQAKVVLKSALTGTTLDNDMSGATLESPTLKNVRETEVSLGTTSGSITFDVSAGPYQTLTTSGNVSLAFSNWPTSDHCKARLAITVANTSHTLTVPASVTRGTSTVQNWSSNVISFGSTGTYEFEFNTSNGGSTIAIQDLNRIGNNYDTINLGVAELQASDSTIPDSDVGITAEWVDTWTTGEVNLPDGTEGQFKTFVMQKDGGNLQINVTSAGWNSGASGTITLNDVGDGCLLQFINSNWYVLGNNGCTIA